MFIQYSRQTKAQIYKYQASFISDVKYDED